MDLREHDAHHEDVYGHLRAGPAVHRREQDSDGHPEAREHVADGDCRIVGRYYCITYRCSCFFLNPFVCAQGVLSWALVIPFDVMKTSLQAEYKYNNTLDCVRRHYKVNIIRFKA